MPNLSIWNVIALIGIACVVVAIVGSGIKFYRVEVDAISSLRRQILLAAFGFALIGVGLIGEFRSRPTESERDGGDVARNLHGNVTAPDTARERIEVIIRITSLARNQSVAAREFVRGQGPRDTQIWLIVHPRESDDCWAQGPGTVNADGTWQIMGHFGEAGIQDAGKPYEVRAIANPRLSADRPLEAGPVNCELDAPSKSEWVNVVRL